MESTQQTILFHKRPISDLKFHPDGDVFFAASKDWSASMINLDGKLLGSFDKHQGAVSAIDAHQNQLASAALDLSVIVWDLLTGAVASEIEVPSIVRGVDFGPTLHFCTDHSMGKECFLGHWDPRAPAHEKLVLLDVSTTKLFRSEDSLVFSSVDGSVSRYDLRAGKVVCRAPVHRGKITNLKPSTCRSFFVTCSLDSSAAIVDTDTLSIKKKFDCDEPINSACIFSTNDKLVAVGGMDARDVTTTKGKSTFDTCVYDVVTQAKVGSYTTHFGTINALDVHPTLDIYCSGGEDGGVCLVRPGSDFAAAPFTDFNQ
ncbi:translation initiation factor 3 subunit I [Pancytospora philotis]|nr:translation initiation factor 3 subunit I [Pancytospora philotis]